MIRIQPSLSGGWADYRVEVEALLLIVRAASEAEGRLVADCWAVKGLLRTVQIEPWRLRLGALEPAASLGASP